MWTSLRNFLFDKFFPKPEIDPHLSTKDCSTHFYRKRFKLSELSCNSHDLPHSPRAISMHKESVKENNDDEDECCIIAEISRRKKPGGSFKECSLQSNSPKPLTVHSENNYKHDNNTDILKKSDCNRKNRFEKYFTKNHRLFVTQRALSQGKIVKSKLSFKNNLKKNMNLLQESYRLMEKFQYMQLLRSQTTHNFLSRKTPLKRLTFSSEAIPVIDLTDTTTDEKVLKASTDSEDQDVQIVEEISRVGTLQDMLKIKPVDTKEIVQGILCRHSKNEKKLSDNDIVKDNTVNLLDDDSDQEQTSFEDLEEKWRNFMQITSSKTQKNYQSQTESEEHYSLPELTIQQEEKIKEALVSQPSSEVLSEGFGLKITRQDMQTLAGLNWLNDEVINFYMNLIMERSRRNNALPKVHAFNTFFYSKLVSCGYMSLRRWTKKVDIFAFDIILVPIHLGMHWCMAVIDFRCKSVQYYDSVGSPNNTCLEKLLLYLKAESLDKKEKVFCTSNWEKSNVEDIPQQMNGSDCGVFSCMFAEHLSRDCGILFTQDDMPYFRKKMVIEILEKKILF